MYPEYSSKNTLFTAFINGLASLKPMSVPNFGIYNKAQDQGFRFANNMSAYQEEIFKALKSSGAYPA